MQSLKESIAYRVPMLVYPVWWDQFGYAARVAYYGLGLTGKLGKESPKAMKQKMEKLLMEGLFKTNLADFEAAISKKYTPGQIIETFESVMAKAVIV